MKKVTINYINAWTGARTATTVLWHPERSESLPSKLPGLWLDASGTEIGNLTVSQISPYQYFYYPTRPKNLSIVNSADHQLAASVLASHLGKILSANAMSSAICSYIQAPAFDVSDRIELGLIVRSANSEQKNDPELRSCYYELDATRAKVGAETKNVKVVESQLVEARIALDVIKKQYDEICAEKARCETDLARVKIEQNNNSIKFLMADRDALATEATELKSRISKLETELRQRDAKMRELEHAASESERKYNDISMVLLRAMMGQ